MEDFHNGEHTHLHADDQLNTPASAQVPVALLPTVLQRLGLENVSASSTIQPQKDLHSPHWQRRVAAIYALDQVGAQVSLPLLLAALDDEDSSVRAAAVHALGMLGERAPMERLLAAMHDADWHVRETAVLTLGKLKRPVPPELLTPALQDTDSSVREAAQLAQQWLLPTKQSRQKPASDINQLPATHIGTQGQQMMSIDRPGKQQTFKIEGSPHISHMLKKDRGETMQEQEETHSQEQEYSYAEGYRYDNYSRWEKVTSYTPPKKAKSLKGIGIASASAFIAIIAVIVLWTVVPHAVVPPLPRDMTSEAMPTKMLPPVSSAGATLYTYQGHSNSVYDVAWSPYGTRIASASEDGTVQVWDATTGANVVIHKSSTLRSFRTLAWSPDGRYIASASASDPTIEVWDALTGKTAYTYQLQVATAEISHIGALSVLSGGCGTGVYKVVWSPDGTRLVAAGGYQTHGVVEVFDVKTGNRLLSYTAHASCADALSWSPNGKYIASGSFDGTLNVWNAMTGQTVYAYTTAGTNDEIESVVWSPDSQRIALSTLGVGMYIWDPFNGQTIPFDRGEQVFQLAWSPDDQRIASASSDGMVRIWDVATDKPLYVYMGHTDEVFTVAWSPDGQMIASAGMDNTVQVWPS